MMGIILSHRCWVDSPPPRHGRSGAPTLNPPLPSRRPRREGGGLGKWVSVSPPPPQSNFLPAQVWREKPGRQLPGGRGVYHCSEMLMSVQETPKLMICVAASLCLPVCVLLLVRGPQEVQPVHCPRFAADFWRKARRTGPGLCLVGVEAAGDPCPGEGISVGSSATCRSAQ